MSQHSQVASRAAAQWARRCRRALEEAVLRRATGLVAADDPLLAEYETWATPRRARRW